MDEALQATMIHRADVALLLLAMKLASLTPSAGFAATQSSTYLATIQFLNSIDMRGSLTVATLQASILLAIYEIGHAIYPAAYISVATCAHSAVAMGLGWEVVPWLRSDSSWIEAEEVRRVWWAVVILERYVPPSSIFLILLHSLLALLYLLCCLLAPVIYNLWATVACGTNFEQLYMHRMAVTSHYHKRTWLGRSSAMR